MPAQESEVAFIPPPADTPLNVSEFEQFVGDLYHARWDNHQTVFLVTSEGTILADPVNTMFSPWLKDVLKEQFDSEVKYVLYSHHHWDHASGGAIFVDTAELIGVLC